MLQAIRRPPREQYVRFERHRNNGGHVDVGVEIRGGDMLSAMKLDVLEWARRIDDAQPFSDAWWYAEAIAERIAHAWPDRAYFVESFTTNVGDEWIQIFQPYGVPVNR